MNSLLQQTMYLCSQNHNISDHQLKFILINLATKIQKLQRAQTSTQSRIMQTPQNSLSQELMEKIQAKIIEMQERRKMWDDTMSDIFAQKKNTDKLFKQRMQKVQSLSNLIQGMTKMQSDMEEKIKTLENDRNTMRVIIMDKIQKTKQLFTNELQTKYIELKKQLQNKYKQKQLNQARIQVKCTELCKVKNNEQCQSEEKKQICKQEQNSQLAVAFRNNPQNCSNFQVFVSNINNIQQLRDSVRQNNAVIERFQKKIITLGTKLQAIELKLSDFFGGQNDSVQKTEPKSNYRQIQPKVQQPPQRHPEPPINPNLFLLTFSKNFHKFLVQGKTVTYINKTSDISCILFGSVPLRAKSSFTIQIVNSANNYISIGIADEKYHKLHDVWGEQNFILMRGFKGQVYCGPTTKVRETVATFKTGDKVTVDVSFMEYKISWLINGNLRAVYKSAKIGENNIKWVPIVRFFNPYDSIKWL